MLCAPQIDGTVGFTIRSRTCLFCGCCFVNGRGYSPFRPRNPQRCLSRCRSGSSTVPSRKPRGWGAITAATLLPQKELAPYCLTDERSRWLFTAILGLKTWSEGSPTTGRQMGFWEQTDPRTGDLLCLQPPVGMQAGTAAPTAASALRQS